MVPLITYMLNGKNSSEYVDHTGKQYIFHYPCGEQPDCYPFIVTFQPRFYQFECWGGGFEYSSFTRYGAYTKGSIFLHNQTTLYFHLGCSVGTYNVLPPNVYLYSSTYPSGATDIRLDHNDYNDFNSRKSRIMVAGAGGSYDNYLGKAGHGGTIFGESSIAVNNSNEPLEAPVVVPGGSQNGTCNCSITNNCFQGGFGIASYQAIR